jgi:hypothetical protein
MLFGFGLTPGLRDMSKMIISSEEIDMLLGCCKPAVWLFMGNWLLMN